MKKTLIALTVWLLAQAGYAQTDTVEMDVHSLTEELMVYPDEDIEYEEVYENLLQILSSPYDLNRVAREELEFLQMLTDAQIESFLTYRSEQVNIVDVHELQAIPGFDVGTITRLMPFVKVSDPANRIDRSLINRVFSEGNSYLVTRYERTLQHERDSNSSSGEDAYTGSPDKIYLRFRSAVSGDFSVGFTGEKDAGEKILFEPRNHQWGFDYTSWHVQLRNKGRISNIIIGDFQMQFAQGLMLGGAFGLGKGGESIATTRRSNIGFLPYTSINESAYQRGVAATVTLFPNTMLSCFYSRARRDATTENEVDPGVAMSLQSAGYHRTERERAKRKTVLEQNAGLVLHLKRKNTEGGVLFNATNFDVPIKPKASVYNQGAFHGSTNMNAGVFINYTIANMSFFGEAVQSVGSGRAALLGGLMNLHKNFEVSIVYRNYMRDYHSFYSNAFSEHTTAQNERGVYWGWKYRWNRRVGMSGYVDLFTFPWLGFRRYIPSEGYEWLLRTSYRPTKRICLAAQFREESKQRNLPDPTNIYRSGVGVKSNAAITCDYGIGEKIRLRSRIQYNVYEHADMKAEGMALVQDVSLSAGSFKFTGRHALFDSDHYENRHYVYENDAWLSYSLPAYSGVGVRNYALVQINIHKNLTLWLRYARTRLINEAENDRRPEGTGGNMKNDVKFQVRFRF